MNDRRKTRVKKTATRGPSAPTSADASPAVDWSTLKELLKPRPAPATAHPPAATGRPEGTLARRVPGASGAGRRASGSILAAAHTAGEHDADAAAP